MSSSVIACRNVWKLFGQAPQRYLANLASDTSFDTIRADGYIAAVRDVSLDIKQGEMLVIMGLSGSGKSTLVRCMSRLLDITGGEVEVDGQDISQLSERELIALRRNKMGMVFQSFGLLPHRTVLQNVAFPLEMRGQKANLKASPTLTGSVGSLVGHRVVLRRQGGVLIDLRADLPDPIRAQVGVSMISDDLGATGDAVRAGLGIGVLPSWLVQEEVVAGTLVRLPLGPPDLTAPVYAVLPAGRGTTFRARALLDDLVADWAS